jgi:Flagellar hook-associated protein
MRGLRRPGQECKTILMIYCLQANARYIPRDGSGDDLDQPARPARDGTVRAVPGALRRNRDPARAVASAGGLPAAITTLSGYGANILADNATRAADADDVKQFRTTVLADVQNKSDSISGVNMDEEMANLILFQNAYAASARVITTLSDVMKTLIDMV